MPTTRGGALRAGALALAVVIVATIGWHIIDSRPDPAQVRIQLRTARTGDGVVAGAGVQLNGVQVGKITGVDSTPGGSQMITLALDRGQLYGLTDSMDVEYAPSNLFGISEVVLQSRSGGTALRDGMVVDLTAAARITDATMGTLLRSLAQTTLTVLTPQLTQVLNQFGTDIKAFAPLIQAMVEVSRAVADTQRYPSSFLISQYASFFNGAAQFGSGFVELVDSVYHIDVLRNDRAHFDTGVSMVVDQLFPLISRVLGTADTQLGGYADSLTVLFTQLARTVPDPDRSHADLTELLDRLDRTFRDSPDGPQVGLDVVLRGMPGLTVPLLGMALPAPSGGSR